MNLNQIKNLGKEISNSELRNISGGCTCVIHGTCNNGTHFTFGLPEGDLGGDADVDQLNTINNTLCGGQGIADHGTVIR